MTDWISVKDRLPQAKEMVLAYEAAFDSMSMAFRLPNTEDFINAGDYYALDASPQTPGGEPMTLLFLFLVILLYDSIGAVVVMLMCSNYPDDATSGMLALVFWPLLLFGRIGIACYRIIRRLLK